MQLIQFPSEQPFQTKFVLDCKLNEKSIPKKLGFEFKQPKDDAKGYWYTYDPHVAFKANFAAIPDVKQSIQDGIALKNEIYKLSFHDGNDFEFDVPIPQGKNPSTGLPFALIPFQKIGVYVAHLLKRVIIGDEMGLGKTIQAICTVNLDTNIHSVLVVTKKKLKSQWVKEFKKWLTRKMSVGAGLLHCDIVVVNYDQLVRRNELMMELDKDGVVVLNKKGKPNMIPVLDEEGNEVFVPNPLLDALIERSWDMLILDECHKIKNSLAKRTKSIYEIAGWNEDKSIHNPYKINYILALTGTPIPNRPIEMHTTIKLLMPYSKLAKLWYYGKRYCTGNENGENTSTVKYFGNNHLDELQTKLRQTCMVRRMKSQVMKDMPPKQHGIVALDAEGTAKAMVDQQIATQLQYQEQSKQLKTDMQKYKESDYALYLNAASKLKECQGIYFTEMSKIRKKLAIEKMPYVIEFINDMLESGVDKILVGAHHHEVVDGITEALQEWGVVTLDGRNQSTTYQEDVEKKFAEDKDTRVFVGGILACGEGLNLTAAHHVVFAELDWVPANIKQFEDRTHRIGQDEHVQVQHLVFDGSLDSKFIEKLIEKQAIEDAALNTHATKPAEMEEEAA